MRIDTASVSLVVLIELSSSDTRTGAVNDAIDLARIAKQQGVEVVLCGRLDSHFLEQSERLGIKTIAGKSRAISKAGLLPYAANVFLWMLKLAWWRPHVVHLNYTWYGPSLALAARLCQIPVVGRAGGSYHPQNPSNQWINAYVANCEPHARSLLESPLAGRVQITGDLFHKERLNDTKPFAGPLPPRDPGRPCFLFLGQLVERKGLSVLVDAIALAEVDADFWLVGGDWNDPGYPRLVRKRIKDLGIEEHIHLVDHRPDAAALIAACDALVLPSLEEARPRCIIEAMLLGRPVVATSVGGIPTLIEEDVTGLLVPPSDHQALAASLRRLAASKELRSRLGTTAQRQAQEAFRPERTVQRYVEVYRGLVASSALIHRRPKFDNADMKAF